MEWIDNFPDIERGLLIQGGYASGKTMLALELAVGYLIAHPDHSVYFFCGEHTSGMEWAKRRFAQIVGCCIDDKTTLTEELDFSTEPLAHRFYLIDRWDGSRMIGSREYPLSLIVIDDLASMWDQPQWMHLLDQALAHHTPIIATWNTRKPIPIALTHSFKEEDIMKLQHIEGTPSTIILSRSMYIAKCSVTTEGLIDVE